MILIDTSVWISLFRQEKTGLGESVWSSVAKNEAAICGQIFVEFIGGFRDAKKRSEFSGSFSKFPYLETSQEAFKMAADLLGQFPRLGSGDAIIAATSITHQAPLLTLDNDFSALHSHGLTLMNPVK